MNVSELAREVGIAPSAVRFYERRGILPPAPRHGNGYRRYTEDDLCRLKVVVSLRRLGLELSTAGRLAALCQAGECDVMARDLGPLVADQRAAIARTRAELDELDTRLMALEAALAADPVQADLCLTKGGDDDDARSRLRTRLPVPVPTRDALTALGGR
jgi:MerR family transcriptional regulator, copper efflux regulator